MIPSPPLTLAAYTRPELIIPQLRTRGTASVMEELAEAARHQEGGAEPLHLFSAGLAALNRELLTSTVLDLGAVFPAVRVEALSRPCLVLGRSREPLAWRAAGFQPIDLVFLTLEPLAADAEVSRLAASLQDLGRNRLRLDDLRHDASAEEMVAVLAQVQLVSATRLVRVSPIIVGPHASPAPTAMHSRAWRR